MARGSAEQRRVGVDGGQGVPAVAGSPQRPPWKRTRSFRAIPAVSVAQVRNTPPNVPCYRSPRSSSWLSASGVVRSAISASFRLADTGSVSAGDGEMRTSPEVYATRAVAERALWKLADDGRADCQQDRPVPCPGAARHLREPAMGRGNRAVHGSDLDLQAGTVRVRAAFTQRRSYSSAIVLGPPKSRAGRRVVGIPKSIIPALEQHLSEYVGPEPGALVFCGVKGAPLSRSNFNKMSAWPSAVRSIGAEGLHFHDLRHTGNTFAEVSGVASAASFGSLRERRGAGLRGQRGAGGEGARAGRHAA